MSDENKLTDYEMKQAAEEKRRAVLFAEAEAEIAAKERDKVEAASVHSMGPMAFESYKRKQFALTQKRQAEQEKAAEQKSA